MCVCLCERERQRERANRCLYQKLVTYVISHNYYIYHGESVRCVASRLMEMQQHALRWVFPFHTFFWKHPMETPFPLFILVFPSTLETLWVFPKILCFQKKCFQFHKKVFPNSKCFQKLCFQIPSVSQKMCF